MFIDNETTLDLVNQARLGDKQSLEKLSEMAMVPLHQHVYRIVLREEVAQDIVQEAMLEMCQIIGKLREPSRFWPWLCGIAFNKIRHQRRNALRHRTMSLADMDSPTGGKDDNDGLAAAITDELQQAIASSIKKLKPEHRAILSMRCYEKLEYHEIASALDSNSFAVRMLFFRAKKSLAKQLAKSGYGSLSIILALTIFGKITSRTQAAAASVSISPASISVGGTAATAGYLSGKTAILLYAAISALICGNAIIASLPADAQVKLSATKSQNIYMSNMQLASDNAEIQRWYYYPDGPNGVVMTQQIAVDPDNHISKCVLLQNHMGSFSRKYSSSTIYQHNYNYFKPDLSVMQLPTDSTGFVSQIEMIQGWAEPAINCSANESGLLIVTQKDRDGQEKDNWQILKHSNLLGEDYFKCDWPSNSKLVDKRDDIHKQGFAYIKATGSINNISISGEGKIPLNYSSYRSNRPELILRAGRQVIIADAGKYATAIDGKENISYYSRGSFFNGLMRPWSGLHTIDVVRRDAITCGLTFITTLDNDNIARITIRDINETATLVYYIDLYNDLINKIEFNSGNNKGVINFEYQAEKEAVISTTIKTPVYASVKESPGINWLFEMLNTIE